MDEPGDGHVSLPFMLSLPLLLLPRMRAFLAAPFDRFDRVLRTVYGQGSLSHSRARAFLGGAWIRRFSVIVGPDIPFNAG
jgi:hypothetical protein